MIRDSRPGAATPFLLHGVTRSADPMRRATPKAPVRSRAEATSADDHSLDADLRDHLGAQLRAMFQEIVTEPLPDRFQRLFDELAQKGPAADEPA